jgi:PAS domain S-box-containing protein
MPDLRTDSQRTPPSPQSSDLVGFLQNILESSTEYSIIGKDLRGDILLRNEGARRLYGYSPEEVIGRANSAVLHTPEDVRAGRPEKIMEAALRSAKWEGNLKRVRKDGSQFTARIVITPRREAAVGAGCDAYIVKPVNTRTLTGQLEAVALSSGKVESDAHPRRR